MTISDILDTTGHRPWPLPEGNWSYYQEWNNAVFLHWRVDNDAIRKMVPADLELELFDRSAWVSLVAFTMEKIRPRILPAVGLVSNFHEINIRTYVRSGKVAFLSDRPMALRTSLPAFSNAST